MISLTELKAFPTEIEVEHQQAIFGGKYVTGVCTEEGWCLGSFDPKLDGNAPEEKIDPAIMPYSSGFLAFSDGSIEPLYLSVNFFKLSNLTKNAVGLYSFFHRLCRSNIFN